MDIQDFQSAIDAEIDVFAQAELMVLLIYIISKHHPD